MFVTNLLRSLASDDQRSSFDSDVSSEILAHVKLFADLLFLQRTVYWGESRKQTDLRFCFKFSL